MKLFKGLCLIALAIAFTIPVYAETQSIKLSGDLAVRYIGHENYDFNSYNGDVADTDSSYFMTNAEAQLDADLTDNVSVTLRMVNQHDWNVSDIGLGAPNHFDNDIHVGLASPDDNYGEYDVLVDLAYVTLKEFFFTPLTVRIGKQDLWFGKGFIVGADYQDPNGQIEADEFTSFTSFKAIRATWDFEPWTFDGVFAMIEENEVQADDDEQLYGINAACDLSEYNNAEAEVYYWFVKDDEIPNYIISKENRIHCLGARGSFDPHKDITLWGEGAVQLGTYVANTVQTQPREREAYAFDVGGECRLWKEQYAWKPVVGTEYIFYSGQNEPTDRVGNSFHGWNRMFRGKVDSAIHEWYNVFYVNGMPTAPDNGGTNLHQIILMGSLEPMDNLKVDARYINFRLHETASMFTDNKDVGNEVDLELNYEYTEDVTFGLLSAWFWSGDYYVIPEEENIHPAFGTETLKHKQIASEVVATCKVSF